MRAQEELTRAARVVGLRGVDLPSLEDVERRRLQLWAVSTVVIVSLSGTLAVLLFWPVEPDWLPPVALRAGIVAVSVAFCGYAVEKEVHLRRLTRLLVDERLLTVALRNRLAEMDAILEAGRALNSARELDQVLDTVLRSALELLPSASASVMLRDGGRLEVVAAAPDASIVGTVVGSDAGIAGSVAERGEPLLLDGPADPGRFPGLRRDRREASSALSVPLRDGDEVIGVLNVSAREGGRRLTEFDLRAVALFAEHAAAAVAKARLVADAREQAERMRHQAHHDALTGLANRSSFVATVDHALARLDDRAASVLLFVDLDGFKEVNDTHGHSTGDVVLAVVADRIRSVLRDGDVAARLGGDEFGVLLEGVAGPADGEDVAARLVDVLGEPVATDITTIRIGASVGIAVLGEHGTTFDELLHHADLALYAAKRDGANGIQVYAPALEHGLLDPRGAQASLRRALRDGELRLHYQPVIDIEHGTVVGVEALLRWQRPDGEIETAERFLRAATRTSAIVPVGRWALDRACADLVDLRRRTGDRAPAWVSVNVSARHVAQPGFVDDVRRALDRSGLAPRQLVLEVTEGQAADVERCQQALASLRAEGVRTALDDFGTGYSSLSHLLDLPVDVVKIDRRFVAQLHREPRQAALLNGVTALARDLGLEVIAEGIELDAQLRLVQLAGCALAQGYLFVRPLPLDELVDVIRERDTDHHLELGPGRPTAVVCDDDATARHVVAALLEDAGYEVLATVGTAPELVDVARVTQPTVAIVDVSLPGTSGIEALPDLAAAAPDTVVVMFSAFDAVREAAASGGAHGFVDKSTPQRLLEVLAQVRAAAGA